MRIGIASTFPPYRGGIAQFNAAMADALKAAGHEVSMATWSRQYPNWLFPGTSQWEPNKSLSDVDIPASIDSLSPLSWARTGRALASASDVVVLPFWHAALAPALTGVARAAKKHGVKKVFALMHNASSHDGNAMHKALTTRFLGCVDGVFTLSQPVSELLTGWQPHTLFHPLYDHHKRALRKEEARRQLGIDKDRVVHLFFGLIRPYKGLHVLLKAMSELPEHHVAVVAGECYGPWEPYGDAITALNLEERIHVHQGFVDDRDVPVFFGAADHVVLPYL
ncbi:MAG: glycosyltransferase, partial [Bacteroidota bacterium]|nr:glycosyltransferase [Bacteroidota bacterium]